MAVGINDRRPRKDISHDDISVLEPQPRNVPVPAGETLLLL
jgi:hypothetical protein